MRTILVALLISPLALLSPPADPATWHVDGSVAESGNGKSWDSAFKTVQEGIDGASTGDTVVVAQGIYFENIKFGSKNIVLTSTNPLDPAAVAKTVIDGRWRGSVVNFSGGEDESCILAGFTIQHGRASSGGGINSESCGEGTHATICYNVIRANVGFPDGSAVAPSSQGSDASSIVNATGTGGGLAYCYGVVEQNTVTENYARYGGGMYACGGTIRDNTISWNMANEQGGGLCKCDGTIEDNTISLNFAETEGGGLYGCGGTIQKNVVRENSAEAGGGLCECDGDILENEISGNPASEGGGLYGCDGNVRDNTIGGNSATSGGGGAAFCNGTIEGNGICRNSGGFGGGLHRCGGVVRMNTISENRAGDGGGLAQCSGTISLNTITGNFAEGKVGGGLWDCEGTIEGNSISGNSAPCGGGLYGCDGTVQNNRMFANHAEFGGGLYECDGTIENNTIYGNSAGHAGGLSLCAGMIRNCIIWGNTPRPQMWSSSVPTYSCIEGWAGGGEGNMAFDPYFVKPEGADFHLSAWSPCIDAGDPSSSFSNEPEPNGGRVDMGAYGNSADATCKSPDSDGDGLPDNWETLWFGSLDEQGVGDPDGDRVPNLTEWRYGWGPTLAAETPVNNHTKNTWYPTIQAALCESDHGDQIVVEAGTYLENIYFGGKNVVLTGPNPLDPSAVASTILDGNSSGSTVTFSGGETDACVLEGLTIRGGNGRYGAGICGGNRDVHTHATIRNNVLVGNSASWEGGGAAYCDGIIESNLITGNSAPHGGGLFDCDGMVINNVVSENLATEGGGLNYCEATVSNNLITGNSARFGGGLRECRGEIQGNVIRGNSAENGGGLAGCHGTIENNLIFDNTAERREPNTPAFGGGLYGCTGVVQNNTIVANEAFDKAGGLCYCEGAIMNCIVWGNTAKSAKQVYGSSLPSFSCIQEWVGAGEGNIVEEPRFVHAENGDFRLLPDSPCIDAGFNDPDLSDTDIAGMHRIMFGWKSLTVDIGAYEYYINEMNPAPSADEMALTWSSLADKSYSIFYSDDLLTWHLAVESFASAGPTATSWIDDGSLTGAPPSVALRRFYRILEKP